MKKVDHRRRVWLQRRDHRLRRRSTPVRRAKVVRIRINRHTIQAPSYFCIAAIGNHRSDAAARFLEFVEALRTFQGKNLCVDMSRVSRLVVNAALLFKAELCYLKSRGVNLTGVAARKARTEQVLTQTGINEVLGLPASTSVDREDTLHWRHVSGAWDLAQPSRLGALLDPGTNPNASSLYTGMIESVANCIEHAYLPHPKRRVFGVEQDGWWGFQQLRDGFLSTCICDLGIGIANALPIRLSAEPGLLGKLFSLLHKAKGEDVRSILAAIEYGRSSTKEPQRGKGLRDAHRVIDDAGEGLFQLASNAGFYFYRRDPNKESATTGTRRLQGSISGTIYFWRYPIKSDLVSDHSDIQGFMP